MKEKFEAIVNSIGPFINGLENNRSLSSIGKFFKPIRSEKLMRDLTFTNEPVDCLLFALEHLKNGEEDLSASLSWLNAVHTAFLNKEKPTVWHELAEAIRLDIMTQLNGLHLAHVWRLEREASIKLPPSVNNSVVRIIDTRDLLIGLLGYHLGRGLEISQEAINVYHTILNKSKDEAINQKVGHRVTALAEHQYLDPKDFNMSSQQFNEICHDREKVQKFISKCCLEGVVRPRPGFVEKITHDAYEMAAISVYGGLEKDIEDTISQKKNQKNEEKNEELEFANRIRRFS